MKLTFTLPFVFALLVCKAILWLLVLQQVVAATTSVPPMKSVTLLLAVASLARNAKPFAAQATVLLELTVLPEITGRPAPAGIP